MDKIRLEEFVRGLSDIEVALFLSLVAQEHCLVETTGDLIDDLAKELALVLTTLSTKGLISAKPCLDLLSDF